LEEWGRGERSNEFFYGMTTLSARYDTDFVEGADGQIFLQPFLYPLELYLTRRMGIGFGPHIPLTHLRILRKADVLVSTVDTCGLPLAMFRHWGWIPGKIIYISQGLGDRVEAYGRGRRLSHYYKKLLLKVDALVVLSEGARDSLAEWLEIPVERIHVLPFGVDCDFWHYTGEVGDEILSIGSDPGRDYETLLQAIDHLPLHVISGQMLDLHGLGNVRCTHDHTPKALRDLYSQARFVVVPLKNMSQPSGQSTTLQAMACGKAVILTQTRGYFGESYLRSGENCFLVPPDNVGAMRSTIQQLWADPGICARIGQKAHETVLQNFSESRMANSLSKVIQDCLSDGLQLSRLL
jgi:glycosyltransferase involved in cell wall biosynthesis